MVSRFAYYFSEALGYFFCELAFKADCRGPFALSYRLGCWFYSRATDAGLRSGDLIINAEFQLGSDLPLYVGRS
jgi:hypothetical protein